MLLACAWNCMEWCAMLQVRGGFLNEHEATVTAIAARNRKPRGKNGRSKRAAASMTEVETSRDPASTSSLVSLYLIRSQTHILVVHTGLRTNNALI